MDEFFNSLVTPSPIEKIVHPLLAEKNVQLYVKREDLIHPHVSGNKWRKLKYNLKYAKEKGIRKIVTFGGAFSNHIYATAAACRAFGLDSIGIIRGEYDDQNPTLRFAQSCGMELKFIDRTSYREKEKNENVRAFLSDFDSVYLIPEGGTNELAHKGLKELAEEINKNSSDIIMVSAGTGGTAIGILKWLDPSKELWVFSSLKSEYLHSEILKNVGASKGQQLKFISSYHYGGYGKSPENLITFINNFTARTKIPIDPIYNGKLICGFCDMISIKHFDHNKSYLWIHTGGQQGITAYNYMAIKKSRTQIIHLPNFAD